MSTGRERAMAKELRATATALPLAEARGLDGPADREFFRRIDRETTWGLTLNK